MSKLYGAQKMVLQAIQNAQGETSNYIDDSKLSQATQIAMSDMRNWLLTLDQEEYIDLTLTNNGLSASITPKGRLTLGLFRPLPSSPAPEPSKSRSRTGREKALVIGISDYPPPIRKLPAVANDVREMAKLLGSDQGQFTSQNVQSLADGEATHKAVLEAIDSTFSRVEADDAVFAYMAGHGEVVAGEYYFIAHDTTAQGIAINGVPLKRLKAAFDSSPSQRAFMWLDFCHSGGIIPRDLGRAGRPRGHQPGTGGGPGAGKTDRRRLHAGSESLRIRRRGARAVHRRPAAGAEGRGGQQGRGDDQLAVRLHRQADG